MRARHALAVAVVVATLAAIGATVDVAPTTIPPCQREDSAGPCVWHADTRGNGEGRSFTVDANGSVTYLP